MQTYPLTRARFLVAVTARGNDSAFKDVAAEVIDYWCAWASATMQSALGDRITPPLLFWDECLEGHTVMLAWRPIMSARGYRTDQGRDSQIDVMAKQADEYLARLRPGTSAPGKSENPMFVDSGQNKPRDAIKVISDKTSDAWTRRGRCGRGC